MTASNADSGLRQVPKTVLTVAALAAAVLVVGTVALLPDRANESDGATTETTSAPSAVSTQVSPPPPPGTFPAAALDAARGWIAAVSSGDNDAAWGFLAQPSREAVGGRANVDRLPEMARDWRAIGERGPSLRAVVVDGVDDDGLPPGTPRLGVVIATVYDPSGAPRLTMALPVRGTPERAEVDPFARVDASLVHESGAAGEQLGVVTPALSKVWFIVDDREVADPDLSERVDTRSQRFTFTPQPPLAAGRHTFTAMVLATDGNVVTRSAIYRLT